MVTTQSNPPLTASAIKALEARPEAYELRDPGCPGLRLRVEPSGRRTFRWYTRDGGKRVVLTIGPWSERGDEPGSVTLAEARRRLAVLKAARDDGHLDTARRGVTVPTDGPTVEKVAEAYFLHLARRRKTSDETKRQIERDALPALGALPIKAVTPIDVRRVVEAVVKRGASSSADHLFDALKGLFRFAQGRGDVPSNPAALLDGDALGCETRKRQRALTDAEIPLFWAALEGGAIWPAVRAGLRVLLLTGVRSGELLRATWDEFDLPAKVWTVPVEHQKVNRKQKAPPVPWRVPLSPAALAQIERLQVLAEGSRYVMASPLAEDGAITEKALGHTMRRLFTGAAPVLKFAEPRPTPHDLRRTLRTGLARLKVPPHVAERCLNHTLGEIESTYDVHDYFDERKEALHRWGAHVAGVVAATSNVVPIAGKAVRS